MLYLLIVWLFGWIISTIIFWIWNDFDVDEDLFYWSLFSFIPVAWFLAMVMGLIKIIEWAQKRFNIKY